MRFVLVFGGLLIIQLVIACSATTPPAPKTPTSTLIGHWRQTHLGIEGQLKQCPASVTIPASGAISCGANDTVEFRPEGTFVASVSGLDAKISGKWRVEGSTLLVTFTEPPEVAGTNTSAVVQFDPSFNRITINTTSGATPTAAISRSQKPEQITIRYVSSVEDRGWWRSLLLGIYVENRRSAIPVFAVS